MKGEPYCKNIYRDVQCCLVSWVVCWWTLYLWTVSVLQVGWVWFSESCYVTREDETGSEFSVNLLKRQVLWHAGHMSRPTVSINGSFVALLVLTAFSGNGHSQDGSFIIAQTKEMWEMERGVLFNDAVSCLLHMTSVVDEWTMCLEHWWNDIDRGESRDLD
jgi:hypothetical protein